MRMHISSEFLRSDAAYGPFHEHALQCALRFGAQTSTKLHYSHEISDQR
ncbi:MAG: hypothetical protein ACREGB_01310 [Candidatus Saccharimonadales bacterium]